MEVGEQNIWPKKTKKWNIHRIHKVMLNRVQIEEGEMFGH